MPALLEEIAPDFPEPIVGWRFWDVKTVDGETRLRSVYRACVWPAGAALVARCDAPRLWRRRRRHEPPVSSCRCGIYGAPVWRLPMLLEEGVHPADWFPVLGTVSLWGSVLECEHGWRASQAYPERLYVPGWASVAEPVAERLQAYRVPVEVLPGRTLGEAVFELASHEAAGARG